MTDIQEILLDNTEELQDITEEIKADEPEPSQDEEVKHDIKPKAKAKGRPKGAINKGPSKPRAKKAQIQEAPVEYYEPVSPKRNLKIPTDPSSSDVAAAMLKLLQDQTYTRQARKQRLYNSWFQ